MAESAHADSEAPATLHAEISTAMRERYVAYRRAQAEFRAWTELGGEQDEETRSKLRIREESALDELVKAPSESIADLAVKLQVLKELNSAHSSMPGGEVLQHLAEDASRLATPTSKVDGQIAALRVGLMLLLNAAAGDPQSLERARQAMLDFLESPAGSQLASARIDETAKEEVGSLFTWIE